jgi:hypothetical protein
MNLIKVDRIAYIYLYTKLICSRLGESKNIERRSFKEYFYRNESYSYALELH